MFPAELGSYDFIAPRQIAFGWGRRRDAGMLARRLGKRAFIVLGSPVFVERGYLAELEASLAAEQITAVLLGTIEREPEVDDVDRLAARVRSLGAGPGDFMIGLGGGAAIDLAKAVAAMAVNDESPTVADYLENVGRDLKLRVTPLPVMAMPTTAGTGAEATRNAVISCYAPRYKKSLRDTALMPQVALVDPAFTVSLPPAVTAASGIDAITQLIESYLSLKRQPLPQALARAALGPALESLPAALRDPENRAARSAMSHAALVSGLCLANSGLGMAHGVAAALGVYCRVSHGAACALMLPIALRVNRHASLRLMAQLSRESLGSSEVNDAHAADRFIDRIQKLCREAGTPTRLSEVGVTREMLPELAHASRGSSMSGNPTTLTDEQLVAILEEHL